MKLRLAGATGLRGAKARVVARGSTSYGSHLRLALGIGLDERTARSRGMGFNALRLAQFYVLCVLPRLALGIGFQ